MRSKSIKVTEFIKEFFIARGINTCFCVTGGGAMHINDSLGHDYRITTIYNHHEQASAIAAEGFTRITNKPAIVSVTSGPGATNAITGVAGAWLDSIPMVVLSGQMKRETLISSTSLQLRQLGFQEFNIIDAVKCMTKYCKLLDDLDSLSNDVIAAYESMISGRKGPIWLDIPLDIQSSSISICDDLISSRNHCDLWPAPYAYSAELESILSRLVSAKKPVLMVGYEIRMDDCLSELMSLVDLLAIPVVTEWNSHDLLSDDSPFNAGRPGTIGNRSGNFVVQQSDFLLCIGCQLSIRQISYNWLSFAPNAYKVGVSVDLAELQKPTVHFNLTVNSSVRSFIIAFSSLLLRSQYKSPFSHWVEWSRSLYHKYPVLQRKHLNNQNGLSVYHFFSSLSSQLPGDSITVLANGAACVAGLQTINAKAGQRFFTNAGASGMGYAIAASIGSSIAIQNVRPIICVEGDGSIQMNIQELQTIIHNKLNIKIFWLNNDGYQSIKLTQKSMFNADERGFCGADSSSGLSCPSAKKIAHAYGFSYFKIQTTSDLASISNIISSPESAIIEVILDPNEIFEPKLQSKLNSDGSFTTPSLEDMSPFLSSIELEEAIYDV